jgi:hypothetical protein
VKTFSCLRVRVSEAGSGARKAQYRQVVPATLSHLAGRHVAGHFCSLFSPEAEAARPAVTGVPPQIPADFPVPSGRIYPKPTNRPGSVIYAGNDIGKGSEDGKRKKCVELKRVCLHINHY